MPKLVSHIRTHRAHFERNQRVKQCVANLEGGQELLNELNMRVKPIDEIGKGATAVDSEEETLLPATPAEAANTTGNTRGNLSNLQTSASVQQSVQDSLEVEGNSASLSTASQLAYSSAGDQTRSNPRGPGLTHTWTKIKAAKPMAVPQARALNCQQNILVGGMTIGTAVPNYRPTGGKRCKQCVHFGGGDLASICKGRGGSQYCQFFTPQGLRTTHLPAKKRAPPTCSNCRAHGDLESSKACPGSWRVSRCENYPIDEKTPAPRKRRKADNM